MPARKNAENAARLLKSASVNHYFIQNTAVMLCLMVRSVGRLEEGSESIMIMTNQDPCYIGHSIDDPLTCSVQMVGLYLTICADLQLWFCSPAYNYRCTSGQAGSAQGSAMLEVHRVPLMIPSLRCIGPTDDATARLFCQ